MQVRTIQDTDGPETICVVFSSGAASWEANNTKPDDRTEKEKLSKCKMYVEAVEHEASNGRVGCNFYLVLEPRQFWFEILQHNQYLVHSFPFSKCDRERKWRCKLYIAPGFIWIICLELLNTFWSAQETNGKTKTTLVTELPRGGEVTWLQNPRSLEDRNSLAKLLFQADCKDPLLPFARCTCLELSKHTHTHVYLHMHIFRCTLI